MHMVFFSIIKCFQIHWSCACPCGTLYAFLKLSPTPQLAAGFADEEGLVKKVKALRDDLFTVSIVIRITPKKIAYLPRKLGTVLNMSVHAFTDSDM